MREYYTDEAFYARVLNSSINYKANAQRIHPPQFSHLRRIKCFCCLNRMPKNQDQEFLFFNSIRIELRATGLDL